MSRRVTPVFVLLCMLLLAATSMFAQGSGGVLKGTVVDESGAALPGVTVTATNAATGYSRSTVTGTDGAFRFPNLPAGTYTVVADLSGFSSVTYNTVTINVSTDNELSITLKQAAVKENIIVTAEAPLIASSPAIGTSVSQKELEGLPLNGRQFANLASLAPGTSLAYNADPTKPGQLTVALNGGIGRNVNYLVDGGDNTDDTIGGALQNFNLEAVQEFTIQTQSYKAEYGRSSGGVLTVVTKTGTNEFAGSVYGFFRDDSLNEKTHSEELQGADKSPYKRKQYGASLGGPIVKDRAHFFATYEKTDRPGSYTVATGGIYPEFDGASVAIPFIDELITAKATTNVSSSQFLQLRYGYQKNSDTYGAGPQAVPSSLGTLTNEYSSILGGHSWTIGASKLNDFIVQWTRFENAITADSDDPALLYPSGVTVGQNINTPQTTNQEKAQFKDDFSWSSTFGGRRHDFKAGAAYVHEPILGGSFTTGTSGQFTLLEDRKGSPVLEIAVNGGFATFDTPVDQYSYYFQDDLYINNRLTVNAGLRYDLSTGFDLDQSSNPNIAVLSATTITDSPIYDEFRGWDGKVDNDTNNWAPRLGFTYDLRGDSKHILRGGLGRYYDFPYTNATILFPAEGVQATFGSIYSLRIPGGIKNPDGSFFQPGQPLPPAGIVPLATPLTNEVAAPSVSNTPFSDQISLGYSTQVTDWLGLNIDVTHIDYKDIPFRVRANGRLSASGAPQAGRRFGTLGNFRIWRGDGEAEYNGLNIGFRGRQGDKFEFQGFYTLSKAEGNILAGADEFRLTNVGHQPDRGNQRDQSVDFRDPLCDACFGPLDTDARHRVTLSALYKAPYAVNVSGVLRYRSALPYTERAGPDNNLDGFLSDLAPGVSNVNNLRGESFSQIDLRVSRDFHLMGGTSIELIAEMFNVFNEDNPYAFIGDRSSTQFGQPTTFSGDPLQGEQRLIQLGARFRF